MIDQFVHHICKKYEAVYDAPHKAVGECLVAAHQVKEAARAQGFEAYVPRQRLTSKWDPGYVDTDTHPNMLYMDRINPGITNHHWCVIKDHTTVCAIDLTAMQYGYESMQTFWADVSDDPIWAREFARDLTEKDVPRLTRAKLVENRLAAGCSPHIAENLAVFVWRKNGRLFRADNVYKDTCQWTELE